MTYIVEKPKSATEPASSKSSLITIEFAPNIHSDETDYSYPHPQFVFGECVSIVNTYPELEFSVCALELVGSKTASGRLINQPYWKYKVTNGQVSYWKEETALVRYKDKQSPKTCSDCPHFDNFHEKNGRGWCNLFDCQVRKHHQITNDCINSSDSVISHELQDNLALFPNVDFEELDALTTEEAIDPIDLEQSDYEVGSIVKIINADEDHTEWAVFEVIECRFNKYIHDCNNPEAYLNHVDWYYRLCSVADGNTMPTYNIAEDNFLWVSENEICHFDLAHNVCTEEVF